VADGRLQRSPPDQLGEAWRVSGQVVGVYAELVALGRDLPRFRWLPSGAWNRARADVAPQGCWALAAWPGIGEPVDHWTGVQCPVSAVCWLYSRDSALIVLVHAGGPSSGAAAVGWVSGGSIWACGSSTTRLRVVGGEEPLGRWSCSQDFALAVGGARQTRREAVAPPIPPKGSATAGTGRCTPSPNPHLGFRAAGHRVRSGHSPPESVQTNSPTPTTPQRTFGASVMPSGELLRHGRYLRPPAAPSSRCPVLRRLRPHRKEDEQQPVSTSWSIPTG
jgi:hypothetical protein